jgi:two-component system response regulator
LKFSIRYNQRIIGKMKNKTILLVEDNQTDAFLTQRALARSSVPHRLVLAQDGVEALDYLSARVPADESQPKELPDIVLLDLKLPRIDGLQVLKEIRANARTRLLPVLVLTSSSEESDISAARQLGATCYTVKPTDAQIYVETIQTLVIKWLGSTSQPD